MATICNIITMLSILRLKSRYPKRFTLIHLNIFNLFKNTH